MARLARIVIPGIPYYAAQRAPSLAPKKRGPRPLAGGAVDMLCFG